MNHSGNSHKDKGAFHVCWAMRCIAMRNIHKSGINKKLFSQCEWYLDNEGEVKEFFQDDSKDSSMSMSYNLCI
jgi:hypothetical protein